MSQEHPCRAQRALPQAARGHRQAGVAGVYTRHLTLTSIQPITYYVYLNPCLI